MIASETAAGRPSAFSGVDIPDGDDLRKCVHCGICLPQCPTYRLLGEEMDSPRGRLYLMRAAAEGRLSLGASLARHMDLCLGCRACESACPSGVPFGRLLEATRAQIATRHRPTRFAEVLHRTFPEPGRLRWLFGLLRLYQRSGLQRLMRASRVLRMAPRLAAMEGLLPEVPAPIPLPEVTAARGRRRGRAGLLIGCVQRYCYPHVNRDTVDLLSLAGWDVVVPREQGCCGALDLHAGRLDELRDRATALIPAFGSDVEVVVTNAAGCGSAMKEYGHWLPDAPSARAFAGRTRDVTEVLAAADLPLGRLDLTVAYHDACHLAHGQRIRHEPRALLRRIPGLTVVEIADSDQCCGSAGVYNLLEPAVADRLLDRKIAAIVASGASVVTAGNPGCLLQIARGLRAAGAAIDVRHPVELLARAARSA